MCSAGARLVRKTLQCSFMLGFTFTVGRLPQALAEKAEPAAPITVFVFNSAQISPGDLTKSESLAARIFQKVGIAVTWVTGLTAQRGNDTPAVEKWNPSDLLLRIRESSTVRGIGINHEAVGFCLSLENNEAVVLFDAVANRAALLNVDSAIPLGVTMAHEMGHLLLQSATHALAGVMKSRWLAEDLTAAERGNLTFTGEEGRSMRNRLRRRIAKQIRKDTVSCPGDFETVPTAGEACLAPTVSAL
jgi:hypothetical protein